MRQGLSLAPSKLCLHSSLADVLTSQIRATGVRTGAMPLLDRHPCNLRRRREGPAGFEDGTASYLGIAALPHGFRLLQRLGGFGAIHAHTQQLTRFRPPS